MYVYLCVFTYKLIRDAWVHNFYKHKNLMQALSLNSFKALNACLTIFHD